MMRRLTVLIGFALLAGAVVFFAVRETGSPDSAPERSGTAGDARSASDGVFGEKARARVVSEDRPGLGRRPKPVLGIAGIGSASADGDDGDEEDEDGVKLTSEERGLARAIEDSLDREDLALAIRCASQALQSRVRSIRESMVDTLGWFGVKALPELTPFLADADEDIADNAFCEWYMAMTDIDDDGEKIATVERAMQVLTDEDQLEDISGEYVGVDEKLAVGSLLRVIEGGGSASGIAKAKETYEFVTGEEFSGRAAAEKWIAEEYEPPEDGE